MVLKDVTEYQVTPTGTIKTPLGKTLLNGSNIAMVSQTCFDVYNTDRPTHHQLSISPVDPRWDRAGDRFIVDQEQNVSTVTRHPIIYFIHFQGKTSPAHQQIPHDCSKLITARLDSVTAQYEKRQVCT